MNGSLKNARKLLAIGTGIGVEIGGEDLRVTIARVRPTGVEVLGAASIGKFRERGAAEWGGQYAEFIRRAGAGHLAATVVLPRREVIVRQLSLPGVGRRDLAAAIQFQIESLHPYPEDEAVWAWAPLGGTGSVLIGITRREVLERYITLFSEAGVKVSAFTFSAAALYSALRLLVPAPPSGFLALMETEEGLEAYGESEARPVFSAAFDLPPAKAAALGSAELRLSEQVQPVAIEALLPHPGTAPQDYEFSRDALTYAAALAGACPRLALPVNLLPAEHRSYTSRAMYYPTAALAGILLLTLVALGAIRPVEDRKYQAALAAEITRLEPRAAKALNLDRAIDRTRSRARLLDEFRRRTSADLNVLAELTKLLEPPGWINNLELNRTTLVLSGQTEQAAPLLKLLDNSPLFQGSQFTSQLGRAGRNEVFRIQSNRKGSGQ